MTRNYKAQNITLMSLSLSDTTKLKIGPMSRSYLERKEKSNKFKKRKPKISKKSMIKNNRHLKNKKD